MERARLSLLEAGRFGKRGYFEMLLRKLKLLAGRRNGDVGEA